MMQNYTRGAFREYVRLNATTIDRDNDNPFGSSVWTLHFLDQVARDDWHFWVVSEGDKPSMLLYSDSSNPRELRALTNYYASLITPFIAQTNAASAAFALRDLKTAKPTPAVVNLAPLKECDAALLMTAFRSTGWISRLYTCFGNWYLPCRGLSFDTYMQSRPSQVVNTWTRKAKRFDKGTDGARLQLITQPADVETAMQAYAVIYEKSWKKPEPYPQFVAGWAQRCAELGWLRLGIAWLGDTPIAVQFWFTTGGRAYIFKLAYDEASAKLSAGTVLSAFLFKHALDVDRVIEIDYLTGDDTYKRSWMSERRERVGVIACNPRTLQGAFRAGVETAGAVRHQILRRPPAMAAP